MKIQFGADHYYIVKSIPLSPNNRLLTKEEEDTYEKAEQEIEEKQRELKTKIEELKKSEKESEDKKEILQKLDTELRTVIGSLNPLRTKYGLLMSRRQKELEQEAQKVAQALTNMKDDDDSYSDFGVYDPDQEEQKKHKTAFFIFNTNEIRPDYMITNDETKTAMESAQNVLSSAEKLNNKVNPGVLDRVSTILNTHDDVRQKLQALLEDAATSNALKERIKTILENGEMAAVVITDKPAEIYQATTNFTDLINLAPTGRSFHKQSQTAQEVTEQPQSKLGYAAVDLTSSFKELAYLKALLNQEDYQEKLQKDKEATAV